MIPLLNLLTSKLTEVTSSVYLDQAPQGAALPYIVYEQTSDSEPDEAPNMIMFEVEVWANRNDTTALEMLAQAIDDKLHRYRYEDASLSVIFHRTDRGPASSTDLEVRGRSLTFEARVYYMTGG